MAQWRGASESGILRKNKPKENHEELLVFGYACKLFRDDEKALYIDQGKHLIPWMGDEKLKIDRYDCRGALSDLRSYEASREGFDAMRWLGLNETERKLEQLCDKERYYSLHINEEEEEMYKEEEQKRQTTNAIQYSYDVPMDPDSKPEIPTVPEADEEEEEYIPPPGLDVPVDTEIPKTVKESTRIEKTALFVCKQGPQMEILIKAKQADNPQFSFLNQGDPLYKFYRHVLSAFKSGRYEAQKPPETPETASNDDSSGHYLHPSLLSTSLQSDSQSRSTAISIPTVQYKPSANCTYSQLVNRIQGNQNEVPAEPKTAEVPQNFSQMTYEQQQYYQYYYASQYYEYYKQLAQYQQNCPQSDSQGQTVQPPDFHLDPNMQNYIQQIAYTQYMQHQQQATPNNNSYAQIVSNVNKDVSNPYTANVPTLPPTVPATNPQETTDISKKPVIYSMNNEERQVTIEKPSMVPIKVEPEAVKLEVNAKKPLLLSLAQYGSDSEYEEEAAEEEKPEKKELREVYKVPIGETQIVIDKMAIYVSKNGEQFEDIVKAKGDPRFQFLHNNHEYNKYYREKIKELKSEREIKVEPKEERVVSVQEIDPIPKEPNSKPKEKKVIAPVSFSIKKPKEEPPKEMKRALPLEESDEEEPETPTTNVTPTSSSSATPIATNSVISAPSNGKSPIETETSPTEVVEEPKDETEVIISRRNGILLDGDDPILEMIDLTDDIEERKDAKRAEDRIKDKLAAAAREKLASVSRDRALQLERKKKAAAFLKLKSAQTSSNSEDNAAVPEKTASRSGSKRSSTEEKIGKTKIRESKERSKSAEGGDKLKSRERERSRDKDKRVRSPRREVVQIEDSESEDKDKELVKKVRKSVKKKKSHKRKHSRSKHDVKSKKKSKKRRRRSDSSGSNSSNSS